MIYALFPLALLLLLLAMQRRSLLSAVGFAVVASVLALGRNHEALLLCFVLVAVLVDGGGAGRITGCAICASGQR